jgi:hypothetical protein
MWSVSKFRYGQSGSRSIKRWSRRIGHKIAQRVAVFTNISGDTPLRGSMARNANSRTFTVPSCQKTPKACTPGQSEHLNQAHPNVRNAVSAIANPTAEGPHSDTAFARRLEVGAPPAQRRAIKKNVRRIINRKRTQSIGKLLCKAFHPFQRHCCRCCYWDPGLAKVNSQCDLLRSEIRSTCLWRHDAEDSPPVLPGVFPPLEAPALAL